MKRSWPLAALPWAVIPFAALAADPPSGAVPASAMQACAALDTESARLACYDKLAGRAAPVAAPTAAAPHAPAPAAARAAPLATPAAPAAAAAAAAPALQTPAAGSPAAFGLYAAEHPKATLAPTKSETLKILDVGHGPNGSMLLNLEGGQLWELTEGDALLASGATVTIRRATLGSYLVTTQSGRTHRAKRLQ